MEELETAAVKRSSRGDPFERGRKLMSETFEGPRSELEEEEEKAMGVGLREVGSKDQTKTDPLESATAQNDPFASTAAMIGRSDELVTGKSNLWMTVGSPDNEFVGSTYHRRC